MNLRPPIKQEVLKSFSLFQLPFQASFQSHYRCGLWASGSSPRAPKDANQPNELTQI